jgi:hypothetical protein
VELHLDQHRGNRRAGGTVRMQVPEAPGRTFTVEVTRLVPNEEMVWREGKSRDVSGRSNLFADADQDRTATRFQMAEVFSGIMLPLIARKLPDFGPIFERYAADLKAESEK